MGLSGPYAPTWKPESPPSPCPPHYRRALEDAWNILGVSQMFREQVLSAPKSAEEWASYARVLAHALRKIGWNRPEVKEFFQRHPDLAYPYFISNNTK